jgi:hypothetical protein
MFFGTAEACPGEPFVFAAVFTIEHGFGSVKSRFLAALGMTA